VFKSLPPCVLTLLCLRICVTTTEYCLIGLKIKHHHHYKGDYRRKINTTEVSENNKYKGLLDEPNRLVYQIESLKDRLTVKNAKMYDIITIKMDGLTTVPYITIFLRKWPFLFQKFYLIFNVFFLYGFI
jgi:hypothetical protein